MARFLTTNRVLLTAAMAVMGCGTGDDQQRVGVSGMVTLGHEPLATGAITFVPLQSGPVANGQISDGSYVIPSSHGPGRGKYRIEIDSVRPTGKLVKDRSNPREVVEERRNVVPRRYNTESNLIRDIELASAQEMNFSLDPKEEPIKPSRVTKPRGARR